jgi:hypothetical protein
MADECRIELNQGAAEVTGCPSDEESILFFNVPGQPGGYGIRKWNDLCRCCDEVMYGDRYNKSTWSDLSDFINRGSTVSVVSNQLSFSGGSGSPNQSLDINSGTLLEKFTSTILFTVSTTGAGVGIGPRSTNSAGLPRSAVAVLNTTTGIVSLYVQAAPTLVASSLTGVTFSPTDVIELTLIQDGLNLFANVRNVTTFGPTVSCQYTYTTSLATTVESMPNSGRMAIWSLGGSFSVSSIVWNTVIPKNATLMAIGDSKTKGYYATGFGNRFVDLLNNNFHTTIVSAGGADLTADVVSRVPEILLLAPKNVVLCIGRNDIGTGVPFATYTANYDYIASQMVAAGINVFHLLGFWEPSVNQIPLVNYIIANYPSSYIIDCYTPTHQSGLTTPDGVHLNDIGERVIYNTIVNSFKIKGVFTEQNNIRNQNFYTQSGCFNIDGTGVLNGATAAIGIRTPIPRLPLDVRTASGSSSIPLPNGYPNFASGVGSTHNVVHGSGNFGLSVTRASEGGNQATGAHFVFYKTFNNDPTIKSFGLADAAIGDIQFQTVAGNNSTVNFYARIIGIISNIYSTYVSTKFYFNTTDESGVEGTRLILTPSGSLIIRDTSVGITDNGGKLQLPAGKATAGSAPLSIEPGVLNDILELNKLEYTDNGVDGHLYFTTHVGGVVTRVQII